MRKVLMLAYVFPPFFSAGGSIRAVKFARYLPAFGWQPHVLTIDDVQETVSQKREGSAALLAELPPDVRIHHTHPGEPPARLQQAGRAARRRGGVTAAAINGLSRLRRWSYRNILLPDDHIAWLLPAVRAARRIVRAEDIAVIWATCPPHSAAVIGSVLKRVTGVPLVIDYRDDWIDTPWFRTKPAGARWLERRLERWAVDTADRVVPVTEASRDAFVARYPRAPSGKFVLIPNGCDLSEFAEVRRLDVAPGETFRIVHAGLLSADPGWHRSPEPFFEALRRIAEQQPEIASRTSVLFTGRLPEPYRQRIGRLGLERMVCESGYLPHAEFLRLLRGADLLLAINYEGFGTLVPGKLYEYWAAGRAPILLLDGDGAARRLVESHRLGLCVPPGDVDGIAAAIVEAYRRRAAGTPLRIAADGVEAYDRRHLAQDLAGLLERVSAGRA